jgi:hypothetical protein
MGYSALRSAFRRSLAPRRIGPVINFSRKVSRNEEVGPRLNKQLECFTGISGANYPT